jgi:hypothetical protein
MAANLDKSESSLSAVSDLSYIRGIDANGNSVKISKSDLASVLGARLFVANYANNINTGDGTSGFWFINGYTLGAPLAENEYGWVMSVKGEVNWYQLAVSTNPANKIFTRFKNGIPPYEWGAWFVFTGSQM